jgi:hypothetical protein
MWKERRLANGSRSESTVSRSTAMIMTRELFVLLFVGRCLISAGEEPNSKHGPWIGELVNVFDLHRLPDGWRQSVTSECSNDVTSFLTALDNDTLWANKSEYKRTEQKCP